jgi:hypothetical protein
MHDDDDGDGMTIPGEPMKPWALWRINPVDGRQLERVAEGETREELRGAKRRLDWRYKVYHNRKPVD